LSSNSSLSPLFDGSRSPSWARADSGKQFIFLPQPIRKQHGSGLLSVCHERCIGSACHERCIGSASAGQGWGSKLELIAGAFPIQLLVGSRLTLAGRLLLWGLVFCVRDVPIHIKFAAKTAASRCHVTAGSPALQSSCQRTTPSDYCRDSGFVHVALPPKCLSSVRVKFTSAVRLSTDHLTPLCRLPLSG
jgi:hypothetical protein